MHHIPIPRDGIIRLSGVTLPEVAMSVITGTVQVYERHGYVEPWVGYLAIEGGRCVGTCGFTSCPAGDLVEIAYFTFPDFEKRGIATRMAQRLISIAQERDPSVKIIAHTLTEENASTHVLRKLGFLFAGGIVHPEDGDIWEWSYEQKPNPA
jgi:ribosomal-protein-alanine N-acetyltransferase